MNIVIEDNIDFYKALYESDDEDNNETCLISQSPLDENYIELSCGHKFNLIPIYNEVVKQKTMKNKTMDKNIHSLKKNNFLCPYCRQIQHQLLPHIKVSTMNYIIGVNSPISLCMPYHKCSYKMKSGKNKGVQCNAAAFSYDGKCYCNKHYKIISKQNSNVLSNNSLPRCCAILKSGNRKGQECGSKIFNKEFQLCKRHYNIVFST